MHACFMYGAKKPARDRRKPPGHRQAAQKISIGRAERKPEWTGLGRTSTALAINMKYVYMCLSKNI